MTERKKHWIRIDLSCAQGIPGNGKHCVTSFVMSPVRCALVLALGATFVASCAGPAVSGGGLCGSDADCISGEVCRSGQCTAPGTGGVDGGSADASVPADGGVPGDGGSLNDGGEPADGGTADGGIDDGGTTDGGSGSPFGAPCSVNADCQSQICLTTGRASFCTRSCREDCPADYECKAYVLERDRIVNLCVPYGEVYCIPCDSSRECLRAGDACTDIAGAHYCLKDCSQTGACPPDYECRDIPFASTAEGRALADDGGPPEDGAPPLRQCVPRGGLCPGCIDNDGDRYGFGAGCLGPDCDDTNPNIHPGQPEICDGVDNNCNDRVDETFDLSNDDLHCGTCNHACATGLGCCEGQCINKSTSLTHCGACNNTCTGEGAKCCGGACKSTASDTAHCGSCGTACTNDHGQIACVGGVCSPQCTDGFGDCNSDPRDGCETSLTSIDHCGSCSSVCSNMHGEARCINGICAPSCAMGYGDCDGLPQNGCEQDLKFNDGTHCGACGSVCVNPLGTTSCQDGVCRPVCGMDLGDCDLDSRNGCETDLRTSVAHCGACGERCATTNTVSVTCVTGTCQLTCSPGFHDCNRNPADGCESDLSIVNTCGGCAADAECPANFYCHGTTRLCTKKKPDGTACVLGTAPDEPGRECQSGFCVDGVCCESACEGACRACNITGSRGFCTFQSIAAPDPRMLCTAESASTCGRDGTCDGAGGCRKWTAGTSCVDATCTGTTVNNTRTCDGMGTCRNAVPPTTDCTPYTCGSGACFTTCTTSAQCATGYTCAGNICKVASGLPCTLGSQCGSGFCKDGVCCDNACDTTCKRCDLLGSVGVCSSSASGSDPDNECATQPVSSCGTTGFCSGSGSCALYPAGLECAPQTCSGGVQTYAKSCNGTGGCVSPAPATRDCFPFVCNPAGSACFTSCSSDLHCASGYGCAPDGQCKKQNGATCGGPGECRSGFCADGVCCNGACNLLCEKCNQAGAVGTCTPIAVGTDPEGECAAQTADTCGQTGLCGANNTCALWPANTVCVAASCASTTVLNLADLCNGAGGCVNAGTQNCGAYICDSSLTPDACRTTCSSNAHCAPGYRCKTNTSQCLKDNGQSCGAGSECFSGTCCSGVCRDTTNDKNNCGGCGLVCQDVNTSSNNCVNSACDPRCLAGFDTCDSNLRNGCETSTRTLTNCGGCGISCSRANASATCATGACAISSCNNGFANCDGNDPNGCEVNLTTPSNTGASAENVGGYCADQDYACGFLNLDCCDSSWRTFATRTGRATRWFRARANECSSAAFCSGSLYHRITLNVPAGVNYDLRIYWPDWTTLLGSSTSPGLGVSESITISRGDTAGTDDSFDYWIEVRYASGASCNNWSLSFEGRDVP